jgi:hypothetical protein
VAFHPVFEGEVATHDLKSDVFWNLVLAGEVASLLALRLPR